MSETTTEQGKRWKRIGQDAWVEMDLPNPKNYQFSTWTQKYAVDIKAYNNRTHHPIDNLESGWWKEGEVKELWKDFALCCINHDCECRFHCSGPLKAFPKSPLKPQPTTERKFTLDEMWIAYREGNSRMFVRDTKKQVLKDWFNDYFLNDLKNGKLKP